MTGPPMATMTTTSRMTGPPTASGDSDIPYDQPVDSEGDDDIPDDQPVDGDSDVQTGDTPADLEDTQEIGYTIQCRDDSGIQQWFALV